MAEYINKYANSAAIQAAVDGGELLKPYVAYDESANTIDWNSKTGTDYSQVLLTFEITGNGNIKWYQKSEWYATKTIQYRKNDGNWTNITSSPYVSFSVNVGDIVQFRGNNASYFQNEAHGFMGSTAQFKVYGNIMSLINSTDFATLTALTSQYQFLSMFSNCTGLTDASKLVLPATTLTDRCYYGMFGGCTSLTTAPELPATTLATWCYYEMFKGCTNLNYIKCLATNISADNCTASWVRDVQTTSGTFVTPSTTNWTTGVRGIPSGWTRVNSD